MSRHVLRAVLAAAVLLLGSVQAQAERCAELLGALKSEAMYCGFFCDQERVQPLQVAYEALCIRELVPFSVADMEPAPHRPLTAATSDPAVEPTEESHVAKEFPDTPAAWLAGKHSMLMGESVALDSE